MFKSRLTFLFLGFAVLHQPAWCGHTLSAEQRKVLDLWLKIIVTRLRPSVPIFGCTVARRDWAR